MVFYIFSFDKFQNRQRRAFTICSFTDYMSCWEATDNCLLGAMQSRPWGERGNGSERSLEHYFRSRSWLWPREKEDTSLRTPPGDSLWRVNPKSWLPPLCMAAPPPLFSPDSRDYCLSFPNIPTPQGLSAGSELKLGVKRCIPQDLVGKTETVLGLCSNTALLQKHGERTWMHSSWKKETQRLPNKWKDAQPHCEWDQCKLNVQQGTAPDHVDPKVSLIRLSRSIKWWPLCGERFDGIFTLTRKFHFYELVTQIHFHTWEMEHGQG